MFYLELTKTDVHSIVYCPSVFTPLVYLTGLCHNNNFKFDFKMRKCKNDPNRFCYICGKVTLLSHQARITQFIKRAYYAYFGLKLGDYDKAFAPHMCCKTCIESLRLWSEKR